MLKIPYRTTTTTIRAMPSKHLKCPICNRTPDYDRIQDILKDAMAYRDEKPFNPHEPVIVSETEVYCSAECYVVSVLKEEE